jgi:hypothetical protein
MNPTAFILGLLWVASGAWCIWWGMGVGRNQCEASAAREERLVAQAADQAASASAQAIGRITVRHQTIQQEVQRDVIERPVFRDCRSGTDAVRLYNDTIGGPSAASGPGESGGGQLPAEDPADR